MRETSVRTEIEGGVARLTLRAAAWRTVDARALGGLARACEQLTDDAAVAAVIVTGEGEQFCGDWPADGANDAALAGAFAPVAALPMPVLAAINGPARGAALELALAADVRLAAEGVDLQLCDATDLPLAGGLTRLVRAVGRPAAAWLALAGTAIDAATALRLGLVSAVLPRSGLDAEAARLAAVIASRGPIALRFAKEALAHGPDLTLDQALRFETELTIILQSTADRAEGVAAFAEKREPRFAGQ